jgi:hypothetical protein
VCGSRDPPSALATMEGEIPISPGMKHGFRENRNSNPENRSIAGGYGNPPSATRRDGGRDSNLARMGKGFLGESGIPGSGMETYRVGMETVSLG